MWAALRFLIVLLVASAGMSMLGAEPRTTGQVADRRQQLAAVDNWGYWLDSLEISGVAAAPHDLLVIDSEISANRQFEREYDSKEVARMKRRRDGSSRLLLAYLSIGEAERYRPYWNPDWYEVRKKPRWLGPENRRWVGNFAVQYWDAEWQHILFGTPESYLDRILARGFDGVYLDRADAFFDWKKVNRSARADMALLIARIAAHARQLNPKSVVLMQNAEELLEDGAVMDAIDGIAKEDLLYGVRRAEEPNKPDDVAYSIELLQGAQKSGRKVLVVEYLKDPEKMMVAAVRLREEGFIPYFAPRRLHCLNPPAVTDASGVLPRHPCQ
ncbi:MAG TPA: MJ1477/TM1410 family putative glycoside hydrolase [Xanthobacteraceae bacterium]|jgi:cysteinyl-tRNA synthetase